MQALRNAILLKRNSNTGILLWVLWIVQKHLFCVEDIWTADSKTPAGLFKNTFFNRAIPVAASDSFRFPACSFIKKGTPAKTFLCEICKIFKNIFLKNTSGWLLLLFTCNFEKFCGLPIFRAPLENSLFYVQVAEFQAPDKMKSISQALFEHLIRKRDVAIRMRSFT